MRILVVSDTHGKHDNLQKIFSKEETFDLMLHLGDAEGGYNDILSIAPCPLHIVAGNMDELSGLPEEKTLTLEGYKIWMCHGHRECVSSRLDLCGKKHRNGMQISFCLAIRISHILRLEVASRM